MKVPRPAAKLSFDRKLDGSGQFLVAKLFEVVQHIPRSLKDLCCGFATAVGGAKLAEIQSGLVGPALVQAVVCDALGSLELPEDRILPLR